jgi:hypothetical protein
MTKDEFHQAFIKGMAHIVKIVREKPGITQRELLRRATKKHLCLAHLYLTCYQGHVVEKKGLFQNRYYPEGYVK